MKPWVPIGAMQEKTEESKVFGSSFLTTFDHNAFENMCRFQGIMIKITYILILMT